MQAVQAHYDRLLSKHYTWMYGDFEATLLRNEQVFERLRVRPSHGGMALDLGAGSGFQSIPLARRGFKVIAVDTCNALLVELMTNAGGLPVKCVLGDMLDLPHLVKEEVEVAVCMGDTLTHLPSAESVRGVFKAVFALLEAGGDLILTWRDLSVELKLMDRFIPVRADDSRIFTCFLEYFPEHVQVYDLVYTREGDTWNHEVSSYPKLRLSVEFVRQALQTTGFELVQEDISGGMETVVARKPTA